MLLAALENLELYAGIALTILALVALIMLFPPGGLALAGGGVLAGAATVQAAQAAALGTAGIALMAQGSQGGGEGGNSSQPRDVEGSPQKGRGSIDESEKPFSPKERRIAEHLQSEGKNVKALKESTTEGQKTPDSLVDGVPTEFKTLQPDASPNSVKNTLNTAKKQAQDAVVDARGSGLGESGAQEGLVKFLRNNPPDRMKSIRIIGDDYIIRWP